jgi:hypothetical protein
MPWKNVYPSMDTTIKAAREYVHHHKFMKGTRCPVCDRRVKVDVRVFNRSMARGLIWLVVASRARVASDGVEWVDVQRTAPRWMVQTQQFATTRYWGLIEPMPNEDKRKKDSGIWRPTQKGIDFVENGTLIPAAAGFYNGKVDHFSSEQVDISECFGVAFDYGQLMASCGSADMNTVLENFCR